MKVKVTCADIDKVLAGIQTSITEIGKTHEQIAKTVCGQAAVELANATNPPFFSEASSGIAGFRGHIRDQVENAFPGRSAWYVKVAKLRGKAVADAFWAQVTENEEKGREFLRRIGLHNWDVDVSSANHRSVRTGKNASVPDETGKNRYLSESQMGRREAYTIRKAKHVGLAKAGWLVAAQHAAGRSRVGGAKLGWVRKLMGRASGSGTLQARRDGFTMSLTNATPWASEAVNDRLMAGVRQVVNERMGKYLLTMVKAIAKKAKADASG